MAHKECLLSGLFSDLELCLKELNLSTRIGDISNEIEVKHIACLCIQCDDSGVSLSVVFSVLSMQK